MLNKGGDVLVNLNLFLKVISVRTYSQMLLKETIKFHYEYHNPLFLSWNY